MKYKDSEYSDDQLYHIYQANGSDDKYGNINDLVPKKYDHHQMYWISRGRGRLQDYQNIDNLDPEIYEDFNRLDKNILYKYNPEYLI